MAGSGKTTLIQQIHAYLHRKQQPAYILNLDPAVTYMPYSPNVDIRDTVNYKVGGWERRCVDVWGERYPAWQLFRSAQYGGTIDGLVYHASGSW
jgi:GTPase SAR1 family protein